MDGVVGRKGFEGVVVDVNVGLGDEVGDTLDGLNVGLWK